MNPLEKRIVELSYRNKLTHISSCLNTVNTLDEIYRLRQIDEPVCLGNSHAGLALFVTLEKYGHCDAQDMIDRHGTHAGRDIKHGVWVSGGSLGQAETVAVGLAMAEPNRKVWLVTSDGAMSEGCIWEAFRIASDYGVNNLQIYVIANGYGGYCAIDVEKLKLRYTYFFPLQLNWVEPTMDWPWLKELNGHYVTLNQVEYNEMIRCDDI